MLGKKCNEDDATCRPIAGARCTNKAVSHETLTGLSFALHFILTTRQKILI